jgi:hypothetical protein
MSSPINATPMRESRSTLRAVGVLFDVKNHSTASSVACCSVIGQL